MRGVGLLRHASEPWWANASAKSIRCAPAIPPAPSRAKLAHIASPQILFQARRHGVRKARAPFREFRDEVVASAKILAPFAHGGTVQFHHVQAVKQILAKRAFLTSSSRCLLLAARIRALVRILAIRADALKRSILVTRSNFACNCGDISAISSRK